MDESNTTLSPEGLISFLRDFKVIPGLLAKEDVFTIWKLMNLESVKLNEGTIKELSDRKSVV